MGKDKGTNNEKGRKPVTLAAAAADIGAEVPPPPLAAPHQDNDVTLFRRRRHPPNTPVALPASSPTNVSSDAVCPACLAGMSRCTCSRVLPARPLASHIPPLPVGGNADPAPTNHAPQTPQHAPATAAATTADSSNTAPPPVPPRSPWRRQASPRPRCWHQTSLPRPRLPLRQHQPRWLGER